MIVEGPGERDSKLADALSTLKREGCTLLVAGDVSDAVHARACEQMLGDESAGPRRRLFVRPAGGPAGATGDGSGQVAVVAGERALRSTSWSSVEAERYVDGADLGTLCATIERSVAEIDRAAGGLDPAELRLCVDSVATLAETNDADSVFRFLHALTGLVRSVDGLAHVHYRVDGGEDAVAQFAPVFEATVELRLADGPEQRWHLRDAGLSSEWLPL